jgi:hypothetical protein
MSRAIIEGMGARSRRFFSWAPAILLFAQSGFACPAPGVEICDGVDNDGDMLVDEDAKYDAGETPLCPFGEQCLVAPGAKAQCAEPSRSGTFPCPAGQRSVSTGVTRSGTSEPVAGWSCFTFDDCGGCRGEHCDDQGTPVCGPEPLPPCVCHADGRCLNACANVSCGAEYGCRERAPGIGTCQPGGDCRIAGGCDSGQLCFAGACFADPCNPNPCRPDQVCRGTQFGAQCETSCADVTCDSTSVCVGGSCTQVTRRCQSASDAGLCPPYTQCRPDGVCGDPPCRGVRCPDGQRCVDGECKRPALPSGDAIAPVVDGSAKDPAQDGESNPARSVRLNGLNDNRSGCGCSVPARTGGGAAFELILIFAMVFRRLSRPSSTSR